MKIDIDYEDLTGLLRIGRGMGLYLDIAQVNSKGVLGDVLMYYEMLALYDVDYVNEYSIGLTSYMG